MTKRCIECGAMVRHLGQKTHPYRVLCPMCNHAHELEQRRAIQAVGLAIEQEKLQPVSSFVCVDCGEPARQYHHHLGYKAEHRLDVVPLCHKCHKARHRNDFKQRMANNPFDDDAPPSPCYRVWFWMVDVITGIFHRLGFIIAAGDMPDRAVDRAINYLNVRLEEHATKEDFVAIKIVPAKPDDIIGPLN